MIKMWRTNVARRGWASQSSLPYKRNEGMPKCQAHLHNRVRYEVDIVSLSRVLLQGANVFS